MHKKVLSGVLHALDKQTSSGMFPLIGYGVESGKLFLLTTTIPELPLAIKILRDASSIGESYNLGHHLPLAFLSRIAADNKHYVLSSVHDVPGLEPSDDTWKTLGRAVVAFGAPLYAQKAVGLIDVCGFSQRGLAEQLAALYSIESAFHTNVRRFGAALGDRIGVNAQFGHSSTGDGYYFWHEMLGGGADAATLVLLLCIMCQAEAYRLAGRFDMQLRAALVIDSTFMIYDPDDFVFKLQGDTNEDVYVPRPTAVNAIGNSTNIAARLCAAARPSQILIGHFERPGQSNEVMTPHSIVAQVAEVFRAEASPGTFRFSPDEPLHVVDKHGLQWHCWNLVGEVPNACEGFPPRQSVGISHDTTRRMSDESFLANPSDVVPANRHGR